VQRFVFRPDAAARAGSWRCARWIGIQGTCRVPHGVASRPDDKCSPDEAARQQGLDDAHWVAAYGAGPRAMVGTGSMSSARNPAGWSPVLATIKLTPAWGNINGLVLPDNTVSVSRSGALLPGC
jgi:hypothetical protein